MYFTQNTLTTESEEDASTNVVSVADQHLSNDKVVSDSTVLSTTEKKHVVKAGCVYFPTVVCVCVCVCTR